jgi:hypothetical protein
VADQNIQSVVKKRKISLPDLDVSELSYFCPDSAMLNSLYGDRYRVQDRLVRRIMPHRLARLKQDVSGFLLQTVRRFGWTAEWFTIRPKVVGILGWQTQGKAAESHL